MEREAKTGRESKKVRKRGDIERDTHLKTR